MPKVMDRLSQTQNAVDDLLHIMFTTLTYLNKKAGFKQVAPNLPVNQISEDFDDPATFEGECTSPRIPLKLKILVANRRELVTDLLKKAKQLEYLISVLPSPPEQDTYEADFAQLDQELKEANAEFKETLSTAGLSFLILMACKNAYLHFKESLHTELQSILKDLMLSQSNFRSPP